MVLSVGIGKIRTQTSLKKQTSEYAKGRDFPSLTPLTKTKG